VTQALKDEDGLNMIQFPQTITALTEPTQTFERLVLSGGIQHNRNACMDWQIGNVNIKQDVNANCRPVKPPDNERRKIDGPVAAIMALAIARQNQQQNLSVYERENRGFVVLG
jgi:phage terminase large subunit-like protein